MDSVRNGTDIIHYTVTHAPTVPSLLSRQITKDIMDVLGTIYPDKACGIYNDTLDREDLSKALVRFANGAFLFASQCIHPKINLFSADPPHLVLSLKGYFLHVPPWSPVPSATTMTGLWARTSPTCATHRTKSPRRARARRPDRRASNDNEPPDERLGLVHLLFRAQNNSSNSSAGGTDKEDVAQGYIWIECPGRLHMESVRGQKAVVVHVRRRDV